MAASTTIDVLSVRHADVDDREGKVLAQIRERGDGPVREHLDRAFDVAQHDRPQIDLLDAPGHAVDARAVADAHLVFEDQEEARDDVAHEVLRAEADGQAGDAGAGENAARHRS